MNQNEDFPSSHSHEETALPMGAASWDTPLGAATFAFFDIEMSGLDPTHNHIVELAVIREVQGAVVEEFSSRISSPTTTGTSMPACEPTDLNGVVHTPTFAEIAHHLADLFACAVPVGHGTDLDLQFLRIAFDACAGVASPVTDVLDTLTLARRAIAVHSYTLSALSHELRLPPRQWHHALEDARGVRSLFHTLAPRFAPRSARDLLQVRVGQRGPTVIRDAIADELRRASDDRALRTLVLRGRGHPESRIEGHVEHWNPPYARVVLAAGGLRVIRADRLLRIEPGAAARTTGATPRR